jgi:membrane associated rhomboid family serine protease
MGVYNRDYMRDDGGPPRGGGLMSGPANWSVITWLLVINCVIFLVQHVLFPARAPEGNFIIHGGISWNALMEGKVWLLVTQMFIHADALHLIFNGVGIYFIGQALLQLVTTRQFLAIYLGAGLLGGIAFAAYSKLTGEGWASAVGASGCAYGLLCALATLMPQRVITVLLFFVIPITAKLKTIALVAVGIGVALTIMGTFEKAEFARIQAEIKTAVQENRQPSPALVARWNNAVAERLEPHVAHMGHVGGGLFGFLFVAAILPNLKRKKHDQSRRQRWGERFGASKVVDADFVDKDAELRRRERERKKKVSREVDAILEKISAQGMQSLTKEEQKILDDSADQLG